MGISKRPNRFYPSIPGITDDQRTHSNALQQIRESIETHERRNSNYRKSFIRWEELVELGIIDDDGNFILELGTGGGGGPGVTLLGDLSDVNVPAPTNNDFLAWDDATQQWTAQTAAEAGIATNEEIITLLSELDDINITGGQQYDLLYLALPEWEPTKGSLQFDGTNLHVPLGGVYFTPVGSGGAFVSNDTFQNLYLYSDQAIWLDAATWVKFDTAQALMDLNYGVSFFHEDLQPRYHLQVTEESVTNPDPLILDVSVIVDAEGFNVGAGTFSAAVPPNISWTYTGGTNTSGVEQGFISSNARNGVRSVYCRGSGGATFEGFVGPAQNTGLAQVFFPTGFEEITYEFWIDPSTEYTGLNPDGRWSNPQPIISSYNDQNLSGQYINLEVGTAGEMNVVMPITGGRVTVIAQAGLGLWSNTTWMDESWHHYAAVRESDGEWRVYIDGILRYVTGVNLRPSTASISHVYPTDNGQTVNFGCHQRNGLVPNGQSAAAYIDDVRITKGARYVQGGIAEGQQVFTPPGQPDTGAKVVSTVVGDPDYPLELDPSLVALKNNIGVNWDNEIGDNIQHLVFDSPSDGTTLTTSYANLAGDIIGVTAFRLPAEDDSYQLFDKDFTFETWAYYIDNSVDQQMWANDHSFATVRQFQFWFDWGTDTWVFTYTTDGATRITISFPDTGPPPTNEWAFYQLTRTGPDLKFFINGEQIGTTGNIGTASIYDIRVYNDGLYNRFRLFANDNQLTPWEGYAQETRLTIGAARPSTVPTSAFPRGFEADPNWAETVFLCSWNGTPGQTANFAIDESLVGQRKVNEYGLPYFNAAAATLEDTTVKWNVTATGLETFIVGDPFYPLRLDGLTNTTTGPFNVGTTLSVTGETVLNSALSVFGNASLNADVFVSGDASIAGTLTVDSLLNANADLYVTNELRVYDSLGTDYISDTHDGTDATRSFFQTGAYNITGATSINMVGALTVTSTDLSMSDGVALQVWDPDVSSYMDAVTSATSSGTFGDPDYSQVSLLILGEGADEATTYTSEDNNAQTVTFNGSAKLDSAVTPKFNSTTAVLLTHATSDYITVPDSELYTFGSGDFTVEMWVYLNTNISADTQCFAGHGAGAFDRSWYWQARSSDGALQFIYATNGFNQTVITGNALTWATGTWYHIAVVRDGSTLRLFRDGVAAGTGNLFTYTLFNAADPINIGRRNESSEYNYLDGLVEGVRITKGLARYTTGFTPPTEAFPDFGPVSELLIGNHPTPGSRAIRFTASNYYFDDSPIKIEEQAASTFGEAGYGQLWVRDGDSIQTLMFTEDDGTDHEIVANLTAPTQLYVTDDAGRPAAGTAGRVFFNTTDGNLNIDDGTNWILPDGTTT